MYEDAAELNLIASILRGAGVLEISDLLRNYMDAAGLDSPLLASGRKLTQAGYERHGRYWTGLLAFVDGTRGSRPALAKEGGSWSVFRLRS